MYVAIGTSKMTVSESGWNSIPHSLAESRLRSLTSLPHTYTLLPDDGLLMPETCSGILIQ
jgi:hypothetical protein